MTLMWSPLDRVIASISDEIRPTSEHPSCQDLNMKNTIRSQMQCQEMQRYQAEWKQAPKPQ
jgi:hypothetical protein